MKQNWIEENFLSHYTYHYMDGSVGKAFSIFGVNFFTGIKEETYSHVSGFGLSLYSLDLSKDVVPADFQSDLKRYRSVSLLRRVIGDRVMHEEPVVEPETISTKGFTYRVTRLSRWECYTNVPWVAIKGSKVWAYQVETSDPSCTAMSFAPREWDDVPRGPMAVINHAQNLKRLETTLRASLSELASKGDAE